MTFTNGRKTDFAVAMILFLELSEAQSKHKKIDKFNIISILKFFNRIPSLQCIGLFLVKKWGLDGYFSGLNSETPRLHKETDRDYFYYITTLKLK
jgi:hypothetical protein